MRDQFNKSSPQETLGGKILPNTNVVQTFNDVTLADEETNSIQTDDANRASKAMWQCKWRHMGAKFAMNANLCPYPATIFHQYSNTVR